MGNEDIDVNFHTAGAITAEDIVSRNIDDSKSFAISRSFPNLKVLGFFTPWNRGGVEVAVSEAENGRVDILSPVTFQVHPEKVEGGHDFEDDFYASEVCSANSQSLLQVYPRFLFEHQSWSQEHFSHLQDNTTALDALVLRIYEAASARNSTGVVLEIWQTLVISGTLSSNMKESLIMLRDLGRRLSTAGLRSILVFPPYDEASIKQSGTSSEHINVLNDGYDYFVVMTYDFSSPGGNPGPMAPLAWVERVGSFFATSCRLGSKVLLGINFYGLEFSKRGNGRHIIGHEYLSLLRQYKPAINWHPQFGEHHFVYNNGKDDRVVFYPTLRSVKARVDLAEKLGCGGVAVWELGQGIPWLFEAF